MRLKVVHNAIKEAKRVDSVFKELKAINTLLAGHKRCNASIDIDKITNLSISSYAKTFVIDLGTKFITPLYNLIFSNLYIELFNAKTKFMENKLLISLMLILAFVFPMVPIVGQSIERDTQELRILTNNKEYSQCSIIADDLYLKHLTKGDTISAYWILMAKLNCLAWNKEDEVFHAISNRLLAELDPIRFFEIVRKTRDLRFHFYYSRMDKSFINELQASRELQKKYGTTKGYVEATLSYVSTDIYNKDKAAKMKLLKSIEVLAKDSSNLFRIYSMHAGLNKYIDKKEALYLFDKAYTYIDGESRMDTQASFHREYSRFLLSQGGYSKCISEALQAIEIYNDSPQFQFPKMDMYRVISRACLFMKQYDRAREYIDLAIKIADDNKYKFRGDIAKDNGELLYLEGEYELAKGEMIRCSAYYIDKKLLGAAIAVLSNLGMMHLNLGDVKKAEKVNSEIKDLLVDWKIGGKDNHALLNFRGNLYIQKGQKEYAINEFLAIFDTNELDVSLHFKRQGYKGLSELYGDKEEYDKAYKYNKLHQEIKDSLTATANTQVALQMESEFNRKGQNNTIAVLDQENQIQELTLSNQKNMLIFGSLLLIGLGLFSALLIGLFRKVKSQNIIIVKALEEKDILLKEIHHRVKNNLQLVSSLLTLQSREVTDESALQALQAGKSRVRSMALIHQDLYSAKNLKSISMKSYLGNLSEELFDAYKVDHDHVSIHLDVEDIYLDVDTIIPLGLIVNELMTNTLKYAFEDREDGQINITFFEKDDKLFLSMSDNGVGFDSKSYDKDSSFGNKLINTLTKQLNGEISVSGEGGAHIQIEINDYKLAS